MLQNRANVPQKLEIFNRFLEIWEISEGAGETGKLGFSRFYQPEELSGASLGLFPIRGQANSRTHGPCEQSYQSKISVTRPRKK